MSDLPLTPDQAARRILAEIQPLAAEFVPLLEALDRVLAADVLSPLDVPAWDNAAMDGYAVRSADFGPGEPRPGLELTVVETVAAGQFPRRRLGPGECTRIFTGAPLPEGADSVIRQEDVTVLEEGAGRAGREAEVAEATARLGRVRIANLRDLQRNVRHRGEDIARGSVVLARGTPLGPAQLGVLASIAQAEVWVHRRPRVAFFGSGNEIAELDEREAILAGRKIATSNSYSLHAAIRRAGGEPVNLGIARDDLDEVRARIQSAVTADLLVSTAGLSVGDQDYVRRALADAGATLRFWRVRMRPGAPVAFGAIGALPWIGLPGNPVSTLVTFELFVRPAIRKMLGYREWFRRTVPVEVAEPISLGVPLRHFLRAVVTEQQGRRVARLTGPQGSGILTSMAQANALVIVPEDRAQVAVGETLQAILLDDPVHTVEPMF